MDNNISPLNNTPSQTHSRMNAVLFAAAVLLISLLAGLLVVVAVHKIKPVSPLPPPSAGDWASRLDANAATNLSRLMELRRDLRNDGYASDELSFRIWAAHALQPTALFRVDPPETGKRWNWHLSQDGLFAVAVSIQTDSLDRRSVGLYDLTASEWVWKKTLAWPDSHEAPYVFNRHVVLRFTKKAQRFAMEIDARGTVTGIDSLGKSAAKEIPPALGAVPGFPGEPVAIKSGVLFAVTPEHQGLVGYAMEKVPYLHYAGKGDDNTVFSGNGLLKFTFQGGRVTVADSLTQTVLQQIDAWPRTTNTVVTGALVTQDGSQLSVFLKTSLAGTPPTAREWSVALSTYTGAAKPSFNADALLAKPHRVLQQQAASADGQWLVSVAHSNVLSIVSQAQKREAARVDLGAALGVRKPIDHLAFLEDGRHVVLRQGDNFWLFDFAAARGHADLLARVELSAQASALAEETNQTARTGSASLPSLSDGAAAPLPSFATNTSYLALSPASSCLALRAEWYAGHQAWGYAAAQLEKARACAARDGRAPRTNALLLSRAYILSGQKQKSRLIAREALTQLVSDPSNYNRMIRYQLQGLLFSQP